MYYILNLPFHFKKHYWNLLETFVFDVLNVFHTFWVLWKAGNAFSKNREIDVESTFCIYFFRDSWHRLYAEPLLIFHRPYGADYRAEGAFSTLPLTSIGGFWNFLPAREILWVFENFHTDEPSLIFKLAGFVAMGVNNKWSFEHPCRTTFARQTWHFAFGSSMPCRHGSSNMGSL